VKISPAMMWAAVVVVLGVLGAFVVLAWLGKPTDGLVGALAGAGVLVSVLLYGKTDAIKDHVNGRDTRMLEMLRERDRDRDARDARMMDMLEKQNTLIASLQPPPAVVVPAPAGGEEGRLDSEVTTGGHGSTSGR
jgi:hypothetical protein